MPHEFRTHGYDWQRVLRENHIFAAMVTPAWLANPLMQRQLAYARALGKPIYLCIKDGTPLPPMQDGETAVVWSTPEELAARLIAIEQGREP